jgi:hypothetical protein
VKERVGGCTGIMNIPRRIALSFRVAAAVADTITPPFPGARLDPRRLPAHYFCQQEQMP